MNMNLLYLSLFHLQWVALLSSHKPLSLLTSCLCSWNFCFLESHLSFTRSYFHVFRSKLCVVARTPSLGIPADSGMLPSSSCDVAHFSSSAGCWEFCLCTPPLSAPRGQGFRVILLCPPAPCLAHSAGCPVNGFQVTEKKK